MAAKTEINYIKVATALKQELAKSFDECGAEIVITVHRDGYRAEYPLYDHAALVDGLIAALDYFIDEE